MQELHSDVDKLAGFLQRHRRLAVVTGAGISVDSGIPAYRDGQGNWQSATPIQAADFRQRSAARQRYWTRSYYGWPTIRDARPNAAHHALALLEHAGYIELLITQNVDGLHQKAGSQRCLDLHGRVDRVVCMHCATVFPRETIQRSLALQHSWPEPSGRETRPDGDSEQATEPEHYCPEPLCPECGGTLTPDVVFFGGSIPRERVASCEHAIEQAEALLVIGSSLQVFSGYRLCRQAASAGKPIALVNPGEGRADDLAQLRLRSQAGPLLKALIERTQAASQ